MRDHARLVLGAAVGAVLCVIALAIGGGPTLPDTAELATQADYGIMAGHQIDYPCFGNFYARHGDAVVLTTVAHCRGPEGSEVRDRTGRLLGTWGPAAVGPPCDPAAQGCRPSDMSYITLAPDRIPWGRLDQVLMGRTGYRVIGGAHALACDDIEVAARVELTGLARYRDGRVVDKLPYGGPGAGMVFPCIVVTDLPAIVGDSGGPVFVNGQPAGINSQLMGGLLGFTPLAEGLDALGLTLCTTPDCELVPPAASATSAPGTTAPASMTPAP